MEAALPWDDRVRRRLRLRDLDILMAVIEAGSMSKAAARFNMTQPAVTKVIAPFVFLRRKMSGIHSRFRRCEVTVNIRAKGCATGSDGSTFARSHR